jgi:hypothetical protein
MLQLADETFVAVTWAYEVPVLPSQSVNERDSCGPVHKPIASGGS